MISLFVIERCRFDIISPWLDECTGHFFGSRKTSLAINKRDALIEEITMSVRIRFSVEMYM